MEYAAEAISDLVREGKTNRADKSRESGKNDSLKWHDGARRPVRIPGQYRTVALGIANEIATNGGVATSDASDYYAIKRIG